MPDETVPQGNSGFHIAHDDHVAYWVGTDGEHVVVNIVAVGKPTVTMRLNVNNALELADLLTYAADELYTEHKETPDDPR